MAADWRNWAIESVADDLGGFLASGYNCVAMWYLLQQCGDIGRCYYFQEGIGGVVFQAYDFCCGIVEGQTFLDAEFAYIGLIETFFFDYAESVFIIEMDQTHDAPEVVDPVGVIEWHAPTVGLGRETA